jgi:hypothetical protein
VNVADMGLLKKLLQAPVIPAGESIKLSTGAGIYV